MAQGEYFGTTMIRVLLPGVLWLLLFPSAARSQAPEPARPFAWDVARAVLIDPTTYVPAVISYEAMMRDWKTSQALFAHGWREANPRFTVTGLPNDVPLSYDEGKDRIRGASLKVLQYSALNNALAGIGERFLISKYPHRKKLIRTLSWVERIGYASFIAYRNSADHLRQSQRTRRLAREFGYAR
jgi:hypothetical protein